MDDTRRGFFGKLAQLAGGLAFTGVWAKNALTPARETTLTAAVPDASAEFLVPSSLTSRGVLLLDAPMRELIDYSQEYAAEEYRNTYNSQRAAGDLLRRTEAENCSDWFMDPDPTFLAETYRRLLAEGDMDRALAVANYSGAVTGADGSFDFQKLHAWEAAQFGNGWMHPSHPTAMRLKQQYYKGFISEVSGFDWPSQDDPIAREDARHGTLVGRVRVKF